MFDVAGRLDELRCWPTERLVARREDLVREQRRLHVEELTVLRVLDERGRIDDTLAGRDGVSMRTVRESVETARALESLPAVAAAAHAGELSAEQLGPVVHLADEESDAEWAVRAARTAPADLTRQVRCQEKPTVEDSRARYAARGLRMWWTGDKAMLHLHAQLPDVMGARFEATIQRLAERAKPAKGRPWDTFEHRAADALVGMVDAVAVAEQVETPTLAPKPLFVVPVPRHGPAEIAGIPLSDAMVEQLRASAEIEPVLVDDEGIPVAIAKRTTALSAKLVRAILLRDGHCRCGTCDVRYGLQVHHLRPRSWGGTDDLSNLAAVCLPAGHHQKLIPHGPFALVGNPNRPDGLRFVHADDLTAAEAEQLGLPPPRGGPDP
jgi:hypothetical protein